MDNIIEVNQALVMDNFNLPTSEVFLAMLAEENFSIPYAPNAQAGMTGDLDITNPTDEDMYNMALAMSPHDSTPQEQNHSSLPKIEQGTAELNFSRTDLASITELLANTDGMQMDTSQGLDTCQMLDDMCTDSSPHMYGTPITDYPVQQNEEAAQAVPIRNPHVMLSGTIPQPKMTTIDQSQFMMTGSQQSMSVDPSPLSGNPSSPSATSTTYSSSTMGSPPESHEIQMKEERSTPQGVQHAEMPELPDLKELLIRIRYRASEVVRKNIKNPDGCVAYYESLRGFHVEGANPDGVEFPPITKDQHSLMTDSQFKFTEQVLKALEKGLFLRCDGCGNVFATRFCRSKIFWYSTEKGPIADSQLPSQQPNLSFQKLERNQEVKVFDNLLFQQKLLHYVVNKPTFKHEPPKLPPSKHVIPISPAIFFTFAQAWNPMNSALSSCLVSMVVNPVRARMQRQWGNEDRHESYDISQYKLHISNETK